MLPIIRRPRVAIYFLIVLSLVTGSYAQKKALKQPVPQGNAVMWEAEGVTGRDLFVGPGGEAMRPDLTSIKFIKQEKGGYNKKYRISDGSGRVWVVKLGREAKPETAAVRLLWGLGYRTEVNYFVPSITIPGKGTFKDVRLEARPDNVERLGEWKWKDNPFVGTKELQGLKMMMVFLNNWDVLDLQNKILRKGNENNYVISDLGSTFGRLGNNNLPLIYRFGRSTGKPSDYIKSKFVKGVEKGQIKLAYKGKNRGLFKGFTVEEGRWLAVLLSRLSDRQIRDIFRAANYSSADIETYASAVKNKIAELDRAVNLNLAEK